MELGIVRSTVTINKDYTDFRSSHFIAEMVARWVGAVMMTPNSSVRNIQRSKCPVTMDKLSTTSSSIFLVFGSPVLAERVKRDFIQ